MIVVQAVFIFIVNVYYTKKMGKKKFCLGNYFKAATTHIIL